MWPMQPASARRDENAPYILNGPDGKNLNWPGRGKHHTASGHVVVSRHNNHAAIGALLPASAHPLATFAIRGVGTDPHTESTDATSTFVTTEPRLRF